MTKRNHMLVRESMHRKAHSLSAAGNGEVPALVLDGSSHCCDSSLCSHAGQNCATDKLSNDPSAVMSKQSLPKESSPYRRKSRTEKFHKLFKSVPENEYPIDSFICAFQSDILLQGCLYISQKWFCFYSKIRARRRLLEIPMEKVIAITREKTALIIPNAIGIQTTEEKYVFGSFVTRDTTYKMLLNMWRASQDTEPNSAEQSVDQDETLSTTMSDGNRGDECLDRQAADQDNNNVTSLSQSETNQNKISDESDLSVCLECGSVDASDNSELSRNFHVKKEYIPKFACDNKLKSEKNRNQVGSLFIMQIDHKRISAAFSQLLLKLQRLPRTNWLLAICTAMVLFLLLSAFGLTYKVLLLQARLEARDVWTPQVKQDYREKVFIDIYTLRSSGHLATIKQLHTVLQANIDILEQISASLKSLQDWTPDQEEYCEKDDCS